MSEIIFTQICACFCMLVAIIFIILFYYQYRKNEILEEINDTMLNELREKRNKNENRI